MKADDSVLVEALLELELVPASDETSDALSAKVITLGDGNFSS